MSETSTVSCYICGSARYTLRKGQVRDNPEAGICQCEDCGLVYLSNCGHEDAANFYKEGGMHGGAATAVPIDQWMRETARDDQRRLESFREQILNKDVLDFGCGHGGFLLRARESARSVAGVELEERLAGHFEENGLEVCAGIEQFGSARKFDVITAFHVIEHLEDPRSMLEALKGRLAEGGELIVEVPSADDALLTLYESEAFSRFSYWSCHLYLFNAHTMGELARQAGLRVKYIKHVQRYPLSNHLYWLAQGRPGGHACWEFLDSPELAAAYEGALARIGKTDTLVACLSR